MADYALVTLGSLQFYLTALRIGALPRSITVNATALSGAPVQVTDYTSGYRPISMTVRLVGEASESRTAAQDLQRQLEALRTEVGKDQNTLTIDIWGMDEPYEFTVYKNDDFDVPVSALTQSRSVIEVEIALNCLP